jgi:hypothetical protein
LTSTPGSDFRDLPLKDLRQAVEVYLSIAYAGSEPPESVRRRLDWPQDCDGTALVQGPPFERASKPGAAPIFAIRLGNARYPHMKLQIQPWACPAGYMLSVNTHDQVQNLDPSSPDWEAFRSLQEENKNLKEQIEHAWDEAGLPIFLTYLRDYLAAQGTGV